MEHVAHLLDCSSYLVWPARFEGAAQEHFGQRGAFVGVQVQVRQRMQEIGSALLGDLYRN
jgi:hypothetical protein